MEGIKMANTEIKRCITNPNNPNETVEVLYQKMGDRWFAFSLIGDEVFVGSISQSEIDYSEGLPVNTVANVPSNMPSA